MHIGDHPAVGEDGIRSWYVRLQNALAAWSEISAAPKTIYQEAAAEILVVLPDTGALLHAGQKRREAPARSICIVPRGQTVIELKESGRVIRFFSPIPDALGSLAINGEDYAVPHGDVRPLEWMPMRHDADEIRIFPIDRLMAERPNRPPTIQSETMNVMWIERTGPHDRSQLAPHAHEGFEEGALVVEGEYVQHLRTPWTEDARRWRDDEHRLCGRGTFTIVPPAVVHTTEAIGSGRHMMLNIFAPARSDHIDNGLVVNRSEYEAIAPKVADT